MPRARNIKPGFFKNADLTECTYPARLIFIGLWMLADREGRLKDRPKQIRGEILPFDVDVDANALLDELVARGFVIRYAIDGQRFIQVVNFVLHQNPHHMEAPSEIPPPPGHQNVFNHSPVTKEQRLRILARDGNQCQECGSKSRLCIDHIRPVSRGGTSADANLRALCHRCNTKKGAKFEHESTSNRTRVDIESLNGSHASLNPESLILNPDSGSLIPEEKISPAPQAHPIAAANGDSDTSSEIDLTGEPVKRSNGAAPDCPYSAIADAYHEELPELPKIVVLSPTRKRTVQARWREVCTAEHLNSQEGIQFFRDFFKRIKQSEFLTGKAKPQAGQRAFKANFDFIFNPTYFVKIVEGHYHGRRN